MDKLPTPTGPTSQKWYATGYKQALQDALKVLQEEGEIGVIDWLEANGVRTGYREELY